MLIGNENLLLYLLAMLNSRLVDWLMRNTIANLLGTKGIQLAKIYVKQIPIPKVSKEKEKEFELLVEKILFKKSRNQDTTEAERQIDEMVYALYDLTEQEIRIIEEKTSDFWD